MSLSEGPETLTLEAKAVLFDMDGTLVDSSALVEATWEGFAERFTLDLGAVLDFAHGRPTRSTVAHFLSSEASVTGGDDRLVASVAKELEDNEVATTRGIVEVPGAGALLAALPSGSWAVATSASRDLARARMKAAMLPLPHVLIGADDIVAGKPDPEGYQAAAHALGFLASQTIVFEDSPPGIEAAVASGGRTVVVGRATGVADSLVRIPDLRGVTVDPISRQGSIKLYVTKLPKG